MKAFIKDIVANGYDITDYIPVGLSETKNSALLTIKGKSFDITDKHFTLAYNPLVIGIILPVDTFSKSPDGAELSITDGGHKQSRLILKFFKVVPESCT